MLTESRNCGPVGSRRLAGAASKLPNLACENNSEELYSSNESMWEAKEQRERKVLGLRSLTKL